MQSISSFYVDGLVIDSTRRAASIGPRILPLTDMEFSVLEYLAHHVGMTVSREDIYADIWGSKNHQGSNVVDVHIKNVRKKIRSRKSPSIVTVRGVGYRLEK